MKFNNSKDKDSSNMKKFEDKNFRGIVFSKEKFLFGVGLVMMVFSSCISVFAASFLYNSNEVSFNNSSSPSISSNNVQGAIDELYSAASDYSALQTRVAALEGRWGAGTSNVNSSWLRITNSGSAQRGVTLYDGSGTYKSGLYYDPDGDKTTLDARGTSGNYGQGKLDLRGNPVMVNGTDPSVKTKTVTAKTSTGGVATTGLSLSTYEIISVVDNNSTHYNCIPFVAGTNWYIKVLTDNASWTSVVSTDVSLTIRYRAIF